MGLTFLCILESGKVRLLHTKYSPGKCHSQVELHKILKMVVVGDGTNVKEAGSPLDIRPPDCKLPDQNLFGVRFVNNTLTFVYAICPYH